MKRAVMLSLFAVGVFGQTVQVYSEFARLSESGDPVAPAEPREILSPALVRNGFTSFQIAVQVPPAQANKATMFHLYMGQNPEGALKVTVYRRAGDKLEPVGLPYGAESSQVFWMDVWVDGNAPVRRVKLEPQVYVNGDWITYPMEMRVSEVAVPDVPPGNAPATLRAYLCEGAASARSGTASDAASKHARNEQQDVLLAARSPVLREELKKAMGGCSAPLPSTTATDPEWYLRLRDLLSGASAKKVQASGSAR
jgi:hypothetical protein